MFDPSECLETEEDIILYLKEAELSGDENIIAGAKKDVEKARDRVAGQKEL